MTAVHLHLALNHLPVIGVPLATLLLLVGWRRRSHELLTAAATGLVLLALSTVAVQQSGEGSEEIVEGLPGVDHEWVEEHEEAAEVTLVVVGVTGAVALLYLLLAARPEREAVTRRLLVGLLLLAALASVSLGRTAYVGGQVRHPEVRPPPAAVAPGG